MAKRNKRPSFRSFESSNCTKDRYIKITNTLLEYMIKNTAPSDQRVYISMLMFARGKDRIDYALSLIEQDTKLSINTIRKSIQNLISVGLIEREKGNQYSRIPDSYIFSDNWYKRHI